MQRRSYYDDQIDPIIPYMRRFAAANHILRYANRIIKKQNLFHQTARRFVQEAAWSEECTGFPDSSHCSSATPSTFNPFSFSSHFATFNRSVRELLRVGQNVQRFDQSKSSLIFKKCNALEHGNQHSILLRICSEL